MAFDKESHFVMRQDSSLLVIYGYAGDNLKRFELVDGTLTTLIWDGQDYLQGRQ